MLDLFKAAVLVFLAWRCAISFAPKAPCVPPREHVGLHAPDPEE